ncbi:MAG: hypothetical protein ABW167_22250 [Baekduia sp.]
MGKRVSVALGAALTAGVLAAVAFGQDVPIQTAVTVKVKPDEAGTPSHPRAIRIDAHGRIDMADASAPLMPQSVDVWLPKGWIYNGAKHPACTVAMLNDGGPSGCPPESIMSYGTAHATVIGDRSPPLRVTVINGGRTKMYFWVVIQNPTRVQAAAPGRITKLSSQRWSYRLHVDIPSSLRVVAGITIGLDSFEATVGRGDWIATTHCPRDHRWRYHLRMTHTSGQVADIDGSVPCRS